MKPTLKLHLFLWLALLNVPTWVLAQGTAFNYQGRLVENGIAANGSYDFVFSVFPSEVGGAPLGVPAPLNAVAVSAGQFTAPLDFGAGVFTGAPRWLEISVRVNGAGAYHILAPRQALLPTPYAIFAGSAGSVPSGTITANHLNTGAAPTAGQFLSYNNGSLSWTAPGVAAGNIWSLNGSSAYYNAGNVGIGINSPATKLTVLAAGYGIEQTDGSRRLSTYVSASGGWLGTISNDPLNFFVNGGGSALTVTTGNKVGIGTTTPAAKLTVRTTGAFSAYGIEHTDGDVRLSTYLDAGYGAWLGTRSAHALNFFVNDGLPSMSVNADGSISMVSGSGSVTVGTPNGESGTTIGRGGNRADVRFDGTTLKLLASTGVGPPSSVKGITINSTSGNVGIGGSLYPIAKLEVVGQDALRLVGYQPFLTLLDDNAGYARGRIQSYAGNIALEPESFLNGSDPNSSVVLANSGNVSVKTLTIRGGADVAEPFELTEKEISKGSVVVIDEEQPGKLKLSTRAYDTQVAGIVSGANGISPGISLYQQGALEGGQNVALSGRVYVKADASTGAIKPGDLLTTSATPGHAMKVSDHTRSQGAILGKAMSALKDGQGMVLVLVTLQ